LDSKKVHINPEIKEGLDAIIEAGLTAPTTDYAMDSMQLPQVVASGASATKEEDGTYRVKGNKI
jgi:hypothetical protein